MVMQLTEAFRAQCGATKEKAVPHYGFKIIQPEDLTFFKETIQKLPSAIGESMPYKLGSCEFPIPIPIGRITMEMLKKDDGSVIFSASICPSWTRAEQIMDFVQREKILNTQWGPDGKLTIIGKSITMEISTIKDDLTAFPPFGERIILETEHIPIRQDESAEHLDTVLAAISSSVEKIVDSAFKMAGKPCPPGKAISLKLPSDLIPLGG